MRMKKILLGVTLVLLGFSMNAGTTNTPTPSTSYSTDYCPQDLVCIATNMRTSDGVFEGISIYKKGESLIAIVPGHGQLSLNKDNFNYWYFYANGKKHFIADFEY